MGNHSDTIIEDGVFVVEDELENAPTIDPRNEYEKKLDDLFTAAKEAG